MKKQWLFVFMLVALVCIISACKEEAAAPVVPKDSTEKVKPNETEAEEPVVQEDVSPRYEEARTEHIDTLMELVDDYGYVADLFTYEDAVNDLGVVYANLVDFNHDDVPELVTLHVSSEYLESDYNHRLTDAYILEIWGLDSSDDYKLLYTTTSPFDQCEACDLSVGVIALNEGGYGYFENTSKTENNVTYYETTYLTMDEGGYFTADVYLGHYQDENAYFLNGEAITEEQYDAQYEPFPIDNRQFIISSLNGVKELNLEYESSAHYVADVLDTLDTSFAQIEQTGTTVEPYMIQTEAEWYPFYTEIDVLDDDDLHAMLAYVILLGDIEPDLPAEDFYTVYSEGIVEESFERHFGIKLNKSELSSLEDDDEFELVYYQDNKFYVTPTDIYLDHVIRSVDRAVEVKDKLYYAVVRDTQFDEMGYQMVTEQDAEAFINSPVDEWPSEARAFATTYIPRYMLFSVTNGEVQLYYIGNKPLSVGEIQQYP